jgi:hypothetical protein
MVALVMLAAPPVPTAQLGPGVEARIDIFVKSCDEAKEFGVRPVRVVVVRVGWDPQAVAGRIFG